MRIWWQSRTPLGKDPALRRYEESLKRHIQRIARSDTTVDIRGVDVMRPSGIEYCQVIEHLNTSQIIRNAVHAEREGYDAFAVGCSLDPGLAEIKGAISIPATFLSETSWHLACQLTHKFALLACNEMILLILSEKARQYGLAERLVPSGPFIPFSPQELLDAFENPEPIINAVRTGGTGTKEAARHGAGILVPTDNWLNMILVDNGIKEISGIPVMDITGAFIKATELMVDLSRIGIATSKRGLYLSPTTEQLAEALRLYGVA